MGGRVAPLTKKVSSRAIARSRSGSWSSQNNSDLATAATRDRHVRVVGEVYRAVESTRFVGIRDCKGDANPQTRSTIACTAVERICRWRPIADALFTFDGNWSGAGAKTFNPKSGTGPFDIDHTTLCWYCILTEYRDGERQRWNPNTRHRLQRHAQPRRGTLLLSSARDLLPNGCTRQASPLIFW